MKAVLFDMDGVIIDSERFKFVAYQRVFAKEFDVQIQETSDRMGLKEEKVVELYLNKHAINRDDYIHKIGTPDIIKHIAKLKNDAYIQLLQSEVPQIPGIEEFIAQVHTLGLKRAIVTSSPSVQVTAVKKRFPIITGFDAYVGKEDTTKGKPDPEPYLLGAKRLGIEPQYCVVIEDATSGVISAKSAGMKCIAITTTTTRDELVKSGADVVIDNYEVDLEGILKGFTQ